MDKFKPASMHSITANIATAAKTMLRDLLEAQLPDTKNFFEAKKYNVVAERVIENFTPHSPLIKVTTCFDYVNEYSEIKESLQRGKLKPVEVEDIEYAEFKDVTKANLSIAIDGLSGGQVIIHAIVLNPSNKIDRRETGNPVFNQCLGTSHANDLLKLLKQLLEEGSLFTNPYFELHGS